jgi:general secretion pathway protein G
MKLRSSMRGRTLIQTLCVLALAILLLIALTPKHGHGRPRLAAAKSQIYSFARALAAFRRDTGYYPPGTNGLSDLVRQPSGAVNWYGPYYGDIPKDPWGRDYIYACLGQHTASGYPYDLCSLGPPGANAPIANWANPGMKPQEK